MRAAGRVEIRLKKRIPMGAGLGGGSSDAAAILLGLPVLAGGEIALPRLMELAQQLGSDVPFFLFGGRAAAIGRGTELFPLPDLPAQYGASGGAWRSCFHPRGVPRAGRAFDNRVTQNKIGSFQSQLWGQGSAGTGVNDFEAVVFEAHPQLKSIKNKLMKAGASSAHDDGERVGPVWSVPEPRGGGERRKIARWAESLAFSRFHWLAVSATDRSGGGRFMST